MVQITETIIIKTSAETSEGVRKATKKKSTEQVGSLRCLESR